MKKENIIKYGTPILGVVLVALLGSIFTGMGMDWFNSLNKPTEWVKGYVFSVVWSIIYVLFIIYLISKVKKGEINKKITILLILNGALNVLWCLIFFTFKAMLLGEVIIIINLIASIMLVEEIFSKDMKYGLVLMIYPIWMSIATSLNLAIWVLN